MSNLQFKKILSNYWLPGIIILFGTFLRLDQYLFNRSLWLDELFIAVNFIDKSLWELLTSSPDYSHSHVTPLGFMLASKIFVILLGNTDFNLRMFPLVCSLFSLILFYKLAKISISERAVPLALFLFAISNTLIYYSSEFKQYSSDVTFTLLLFLLALQPLTFKNFVTLALTGAVVIWFSHPAIFILITIGCYLIIFHPFSWPSFLKLTMMGILWIVSFVSMYFFIMQGGIETSSIGQWLIKFWEIEQAFMPSPFSLASLLWIVHRYIMMFNYPGSLGTPYLAAGLFLLGSMSLWIMKKRNILFLFIIPFLLTLLASYFHRYPFQGRLLLFLVPVVYLITAEGIAQIQWTYSSQALTVFLQMGLMAYLFGYYPLNEHLLFQPRVVQETKPIFEYVQKHRKDDDLIYFYHWIEPAVRFYGRNYGFDYNACHLISPIPSNQLYIKEIDYYRLKRKLSPESVDKLSCILGIGELFSQVREDIEKLRGRGNRIWLLASHMGDQERIPLLNYLSTVGVQKDEFWQPGAFTYLYEIK